MDVQERLGRRCNLCLKRRKMTEDHIFPQGLTLPGIKVVKKLLSETNSAGNKKRNTQLAQNGLKVKTVCADCNNRLLGTQLDPYLIHLCKEMDIYLRNRHFLSRQLVHLESIELNKVVRAIVGHILAADKTPSARPFVSRVMRRFLFENSYILPSEIDIYIWIYPFKEQMILRDLFIINNFGSATKDLMWTSAYKAYPFGFAVCKSEIEYKVPFEGITEISRYLTNNIDQKFKVRIPLSPLVPAAWPEAPTKNGAVFMGEGTRLQVAPYIKNKTYQY